MVNQNWKLELEKVILLSVFGNSKSKQTKNNIGKPEHFQDTKFRIRNWMDLFPCVANALARTVLREPISQEQIRPRSPQLYWRAILLNKIVQAVHHHFRFK